MRVHYLQHVPFEGLGAILPWLKEQPPPRAIWADDPNLTSLSEAFRDDTELDKVHDFLSNIVEIEDLTHLDFGAAVRDADVRAGANSTRIASVDDIDLAPAADREGEG